MGCACSSPFILRCLSSNAAVLLLLLFSPVQADASRECHRDTITIDGAPLELQLEVSQAPDAVEESKKKVQNLSRRGPSVTLGMGTGVTGQSNSVLGSPVSRFVNKGARPSLDVHAGLEWSTKRRFLRCEASVSVWDNMSFDAAVLNDSLYKLESSGPGELQQLIRFTYPDLGLELDTLPIPVFSHRVQSASIGLGFGGLIGKRHARNQPCRWWGSVMGSWMQSKRGGSEVNRVILGSLPSPSNVQSDERNDWEPTDLWSLGMRLGASVPLGRKGWEGLFLGCWSGGLAPRWVLSLGVQKRWVNRR